MSATSRWLQGDVAGMAERLAAGTRRPPARGGRAARTSSLEPAGTTRCSTGGSTRRSGGTSRPRELGGRRSGRVAPGAGHERAGPRLRRRPHRRRARPATLSATVADLVTPSAAMSLVLRRRGGAHRRPSSPGSGSRGPSSSPRRRATSFVAGIAGTSLASIEARRRRPARRRRAVPPSPRPLAAGRGVVDAVDDAAGDRRAAGPARPAPRRRGAHRRRHVDRRRGTACSARTRWRWPQLAAQLRDVLGDAAYEAAFVDGAALDGDAAVEHARRAL